MKMITATSRTAIGSGLMAQGIPNDVTWLDIGAGTAESDEMLDRFFKVTFPITIFVDVPFSLQIYWMSFKSIYNLLI
ncbi:hypothetical protein HanHA300_Chr16g0624661 [Helianthus annuus]|nr:hypothetical protein HanHA300_Chr16g0624661 [Helianthus annuus]